MQAIELEMNIGEDGKIQIPAEYQTVYGKHARLLIVLPDPASSEKRMFNPMAYSATIDWPTDGMECQKQVRNSKY